jgi:16S rRNA U516 pseudouridylate synthase RsuA-like enzyme
VPLGAPDVAALERVVRPAANPDLIWYLATLRQGWKRQLRRMFGAAGAPIERLVRTSIGPVRLGDLRSGRARRLTPREVAGLTKSAPPGAPRSHRET